MNKKINYGAILSVLLICILIIGTGFYVSTTNDLKKNIQSTQNALSAKDTQIAKLANEVTTLGQKIASVKTDVTTSANSTPITHKNVQSYLIDDLYLNHTMIFKNYYSNREIKKLFDGVVNFKDDNYDAKEKIILSNMRILANGHDFDGVDYLTLKENAVKYLLTFENGLNTSEIDSDNTLKFNFLGVPYEVTNWNNNKITLNNGKEYVFKPLDGVSNVTVDGKNVNVVSVSDSSVFVEVNGQGRSIKKNDTITVNGLEISVKDSFDSSNYEVAVLQIGKDVQKTISNGDEYAKDSAWSWDISNHSIGLVLNQDFTSRDKDDNYNALAKGDTVCLPNNYVCIKYNGLSDVDRNSYSLDTYNGYVRVKGKFQSGVKDYTRIYVNSTGIYDKNRDEYSLIGSGSSVGLGDTDYKLSVNSSKIVIKDFNVNFDLNETNVGTNDYNFLTDEGILVDNTKDAISNQEFEVSVPEQKVSGSFLVY